MVGRTRHEGGDGRGKGFAVIIGGGDVGAGGSAQPVSRRNARWAVAKTAL
jgi:hypothetical protein